MSDPAIVHAVLANPDEFSWETWDDPEFAARSAVRWKIIFGADRATTRAMTMGLAEFPPGSVLPLHHHAAAEIYHVLEGEGAVDAASERHALRPGLSLYLPPNVPHRTTCTGSGPLRILFVFPWDGFGDVAYHFDE